MTVDTAPAPTTVAVVPAALPAVQGRCETAAACRVCRAYEMGYEDGCYSGVTAGEHQALASLVDTLRRETSAYRDWFAGYVRSDGLRRFTSTAEVVAAYIEETMLGVDGSPALHVAPSPLFVS